MKADLFCRVIDNYGDAGVCWRLARRLAHGLGWRVRLWVDDIRPLARMQPQIDPAARWQQYADIDILAWRDDTSLPEPGDVVIEAFACDPPAAFIDAMRTIAAPPVWINLEYLSAENWVESCHAMPSRRADGLVKYFFFPGFTPATGGLTREPGLTVERDALQASRSDQHDFLRGLGLNADLLALHRQNARVRVVTLFCYPRAPAQALARALGLARGDTLLLVPEDVAPSLADARDLGRLHIARIPFVTQPDFDRVLWCADLNFVRGEDSFTRAAWAARPLVWQIYPQDENAHLEKLEAWLARYPAPETAKTLTRAWNQNSLTDSPDLTMALARALDEPAWRDWQAAARTWDAQQARGPDLADKLASFCAEKLKTR